MKSAIANICHAFVPLVLIQGCDFLLFLKIIKIFLNMSSVAFCWCDKTLTERNVGQEGFI